MSENMQINIETFFFSAANSATGQPQQSNNDGGQCEPQFLDQCIKMADPLLKEPKHVFPSTADEIDHVCR